MEGNEPVGVDVNKSETSGYKKKMKPDLTMNSKHVGHYDISSGFRTGFCVCSLSKIK